jgi:pimeloyl-ACP methyl ester carboxylesterase
VSSYKVKANNIQFYYETDGEKQNVIFLHGMGDNCQMWWNQWKPFAASYRYLMPDVRGTGKSDKTKGEYTVDLMGVDMGEWWRYAQMQVGQDQETADQLKAVKTVPVWVGYSMGGRIALQVAAMHPEYFKGLVLVSSGIGLNKPSPEAIKRREDMIALLQKNDMKKWAEMATDAAFSPGFRQKNAKAWEQYMKVKLQQKNDGLLSLMTGMAKAGAPDLTKVKFPVLFIVGQNDQGFGPEAAKQAQAALPNSTVVVLPTGHASPIEASEQFNKTVMDFIGTLK